MIITLTPNPSVDRAFAVESLGFDGVHRATDVRADAGGKGINISRALQAQRIASRAIFPCGGRDGAVLRGLLDSAQVPYSAVEIAGEIRSNVTVADVSGQTLKVNAPGPTLAPNEVDALIAEVESAAQMTPSAQYVVAAGSLAPGMPADFYAKLGSALRKSDSAGQTKFVVDASGDALRQAVASAAPGELWMIKPNHEELQELSGLPCQTVGEIVAAGRAVIADGVTQLLVSLDAHGALLVTADQVWWAGGPPLTPVSTVGAGDLTLAGFLSSPLPDESRLAAAVTWGRAAVLQPGTGVPRPHNLDASAVTVVCTPDWGIGVSDLVKVFVAGG